MRPALRAAAAALALAALACAGPDSRPAALDTKNDACRFCRMPVSDPKLSAQIAAPGEEPLFFDDIGCLRDFLRQDGPRREGAVAYVADHASGAWVRAASAAYARCPALETPMGSHLVAHASADSRRSDSSTGRCVDVTVVEVFGPAGPPDGRKRG